MTRRFSRLRRASSQTSALRRLASLLRFPIGAGWRLCGRAIRALDDSLFGDVAGILCLILIVWFFPTLEWLLP